MAVLLAFFAIGIIGLVPVADAGTITFGSGTNEFQMEFVTIGNPGNAADTVGGPSGTVAGAVPYMYEISKYEVTTDAVLKANAASEANGSAIDVKIDTDGTFGAGRLERPATGISWLDAARFVNWLNTGSGSPPAYKFVPADNQPEFLDQETVIEWQPDEVGYDALNPLRNTQAQYAVSSVDEWYKAAYHDASAGVDAVYFDYATGSDVPPIPVASGTEPGTAVFAQPREQGPADAAEAGGPSAYGTVGQTGNVREWQERLSVGAFGDRQLTIASRRNGDWVSPLVAAEGTIGGTNANGRNVWTGFRVVRISQLSIVGDFDGDGAFSPLDIDQLSATIQQMEMDATFDLNQDGKVDLLDHTYWVEELANAIFGDADLDGEVNFTDFLKLSANFNQETGWAGGDFDGNGVAEFADFLLLSDNFGKTRSETASVPEPGTALLASMVLVVLGIARRRRGTE